MTRAFWRTLLFLGLAITIGYLALHPSMFRKMVLTQVIVTSDGPWCIPRVNCSK